MISAQVRLVKPDPAIYRHLLEQFALDPTETVFFDDRPENVAGARAAGLQAHQFDHAATARALVIEGRWKV